MATFSPYLQAQTAQYRQRSIPWEGYQRAALISDEELTLLRTFDQGVPSDILALLKRNGSDYALLFMSLLQRIVRNDTLQNILILLDDIIGEEPARAAPFIAAHGAERDYPFAVLLKLLGKDDLYVQAKAARIATVLLAAAPGAVLAETDARPLFAWIAQQLGGPEPALADLGVQLLMNLTSRTELRQQFWAAPAAGPAALVALLKASAGSAQMQYQCTYCLWSLSFEDCVAAELHRRYDVVVTLLEYARAAIKEKVVRIVYALFRNLLVKASDANLLPLLGAKTLPVTEALLSRKWAEPDLVQDMEFVRDELAKHMLTLSTFDAFESEVRSGRLDWTPATLSEAFWKSNAHRLNEQDHSLVRLLARYLSESTSPLVLAVAAHDIGQFVKYCPAGKRLVHSIGAKQRIMELMAHENADVRYQALLALQKYMMNAGE